MAMCFGPKQGAFEEKGVKAPDSGGKIAGMESRNRPEAGARKEINLLRE